MKRLSFASVFLSAAVFATAQVQPGHLVVTSGSPLGTTTVSGVFAIDWSKEQLTTLTTLRSMSAGTMGVSNDRFVFGDYGTTLYSVDANGTVQTQATGIGGNNGTIVTQHGDYLISGNTGLLYRVSGSTVTTVASLSLPVPSGAICRDGDAGGYVMATTAGGLLRIGHNGSTRTLATGLNFLNDVAWIPSTGEFVVARGRASGLLIVRPDGSVRATLNTTRDMLGVAVDSVDGRLFATSDSRIHEYGMDGTRIRTRFFNGPYRFNKIDIWGSRKLAIAGSSTPGANVRATVQMPESPQMGYCMAMSLIPRPILPVGTNQSLNMGVDLLFLQTVCGVQPFFTSGFAGTTDSLGRATASFTVPNHTPVGTMIYIGAIAVNPALPGGLDVANVEFMRVL